jgi:hypothetical protein
MAERFSCKGELVHRRVSLWLASFLTIAGVLPRALALSIFGLGLAGPLIQLAGTIALVLWLRNAWMVRRRGVLEADASGLAVDGRNVVPRAAIASAYVLGGQKPTARIVRKRWRGFPVDVHVKTDAEARAIVDALGLGVSSSTAAFGVVIGGGRAQLLAAIYAMLGCAAVGALLVATAGTLTPAFPLLAITLVIVANRLSVGQVLVGTDGLLVTRLGSKTFLRFDDIERIITEGPTVVVERRGGAPIRLGLGGDNAASREAGAALERRIAEARGAFERGEEGASAEAQLARGRRSTSEWVAALRRLVEARGYRDAATLPERLQRIVEDPREREATRASAAIALGPVLDADGRARLRIAAETSASPKLRAALERASDEDAELAALEEALASLEPEADRRAAPSR